MPRKTTSTGHGQGRSQAYGTVVRAPIGLSDGVRKASVEALVPLLADSVTLRDLYKKHHWQVQGPTFYSLHLLFDKHFEEQQEIVDALAERIQILGGVAVATARDIAAASTIELAPRDREPVPAQLTRLLEAHERILVAARKAASEAEERGDLGTNDLLISEVIRTGEMQAWFVGEHLVPQPLAIEVEAEAEEEEAVSVPAPYESPRPDA